MKQQSCADLMTGKEAMEDVFIDPAGRQKQKWVDYLRLITDAIRSFHDCGVEPSV